MSRRVVGRMTLGMVLLLAEVASLLWTAAVFDRKSARQLDAPAHLLTHSRSDRERPLPAATDLWTPAERQRHHRSGATVAGSRR